MRLRQINPVMRSVGIIGTVTALVTGVTFAALQSQATLTNSTISSATAGLQISTNNADFASTKAGFNYVGTVPGGAASDSHTFQLKNTGSTPMSIKVGMPALPIWAVLPSGSVDNTKVTLNISCTGPTLTLADTVQNIWFTNSTMTGTLGVGDTALCTSNVTMASSAFTGSSASSTVFDLTFTGTGS